MKNITTEVKIEDFLHEHALSYAYYTIKDRALINTDGLKPVVRRLIYSMWEMGARGNRFIKAGTIASHTMGNYHPHGDMSIQLALARLGQTFTQRIPLIEVQGSVGFLTGDKPASARYWEASLSKAGEELIKDIVNNTVSMIPNFSNTTEMPQMLPIRFPVGIINGTSGIAVGYASNIPPHNPTEVMKALISRLEGNLKDTKSLFKIIKGPDFPTGGEIIGKEGIIDYLENGTGKFLIRGKYTIEKPTNSKRTEITFSELPYQVSAEQVITLLKKAQEKGKLKDIAEAKDLSDRRKGLCLVFYVKTGANPEIVLEELFKNTPIESSFSVNNTVLVDNKPEQVGMLKLLDQFLDFKKECFIRGANHKVKKLRIDISKQEAILKVLLDIDKAISIIRNAKDDEEARSKLIKHFKIDEPQADYILGMKLKSLTKSDKTELTIKNKESKSELSRLESILQDESKITQELINELNQTLEVIKSPRISSISTLSVEQIEEDRKNQKEIVLPTNGKTYEITLFENMKFIKSETPYTGSDLVKSRLQVNSDFFVVTREGVLLDICLSDIPLDKKQDITTLGVTKKDFVGLTKEGEVGTLTVSSLGNINITKEKLKKGALVKLAENEYLVYADHLKDTESTLGILSADGFILRMKMSEVRASRQGSGLVAGMNNPKVVSACIIKNDDIVLTKSESTLKSTLASEIPITGRGSKGSTLHIAKDELQEIFSSKLPRVLQDKKNVVLPEPTLRRGKVTKIKETKIGE